MFRVERLREGDSRFLVYTEGGTIEGWLWAGNMRGDVFWGLKALENGSFTAKLTRRFRISVPAYFAGEPNVKERRRFVRLLPAHGSEIVLRFEKLTPALLDGLKQAFAAPHIDEEKSDEEHHPGTERVAEAEAGHREGVGRVGGDSPEDRGPVRVQRRRQKVTPKAKKRGKAHARA